MKGIRWIGLWCAVLILCAASLASLTACGGKATVDESVISSVTVDKKASRVTVKAFLSEKDLTAHRKETLWLFAIEPFRTEEDVENGMVAPVASKKCAASMTISTSYFASDGLRNHLYSRFLLAAKTGENAYTVLTEPVWLSNPELLAETSSALEPASTKGLALNDLYGVPELGISHAVLNVAVEELFLPASSGKEPISYPYAGETIFFSREAVLALDEKVGFLSREGCAVVLRLLLTAPPEKDGLPIGFAGAAGGKQYAMNLLSERGSFYLGGLFRFLAERYGKAGSEYGFVSGVVPGTALNDASLWRADSSLGFDDAMRNAVALVRMVYNAFRAENADTRVYLAVGNLYTTDEKGLPAYVCETREFLGAFAAYAKKSGDFDWQIYLSVRSPDAASDSIWDDSSTVNSGNVTRKYLLPGDRMLPLFDQLLSDGLLWNGQARGLMLGLTVPGKSDTSGEEERNQAISLLYTYLSTEALNAKYAGSGTGVSAVIFENQYDGKEDANGLFRADRSAKKAAQVFSSLATSGFSEDETVRAVLSSAGEILSPYEDCLSSMALAVEDYAGWVPAEETLRGETHLIVGFDDGDDGGFFTLAGSGSVSLRRLTYDTPPLLEATLTDGNFAMVYSSEIPAEKLKNGGILSLSLAAALPETVPACGVRIILEQTDGEKRLRFTATDTLERGIWKDVRSDLGGFAKKLSEDRNVTVTVMLEGSGASQATPVLLYLREITVTDTRGWLRKGGWIFLLILALLLLIAGAVIWFLRHYEITYVPSSGKAGRTRPKKP